MLSECSAIKKYTMRHNSLIKRRSPSESPLRENYDTNSTNTNSHRNRHRKISSNNSISTNHSAGGGGGPYPLPVVPARNTVTDTTPNYNLNTDMNINLNMDTSSRCHSGPRQRPRPLSSSRRCSSANNGVVGKKRHRSKLNHHNANANHHHHIHPYHQGGGHIHQKDGLYHSHAAHNYSHGSVYSHDPYSSSSNSDYSSPSAQTSTTNHHHHIQYHSGNRNLIPPSTSCNSLSLSSGAVQSNLHSSFSTSHLHSLAQQQQQQQQQEQTYISHYQQDTTQEEEYNNDDGEEYYTSNKMSKPLKGNNNHHHSSSSSTTATATSIIFSNLDAFKFRNWKRSFRNFYHTQYQWLQKTALGDTSGTNYSSTKSSSSSKRLRNGNINSNSNCNKLKRKLKKDIKNSNRTISHHHIYPQHYNCNMNPMSNNMNHPTSSMGTSINNNTTTYYKNGIDIHNPNSNNNSASNNCSSVSSSSSSSTSSLSSSSSPTFNNSTNNDTSDTTNTSSSYITTPQPTPLSPAPQPPPTNRGYAYENHIHNINNNKTYKKYTFKYYIKRYLQIFTCLILLHLTFVHIYNRFQIPDTCHVAQLSKEKLNLLSWIGRDVDYIIVQDDAVSFSSMNDDYSLGGGGEHPLDMESEDGDRVELAGGIPTDTATIHPTVTVTPTTKNVSSSGSGSGKHKDHRNTGSDDEEERKMKKNRKKMEWDQEQEYEYENGSKKNKKQLVGKHGGGKVSLDNMDSVTPPPQLRKKPKVGKTKIKTKSKSNTDPKPKTSNRTQKQSSPKMAKSKSFSGATKTKTTAAATTTTSSLSEVVKRVPFEPVLSKIIHHQWKDTSIPPIFNKWYNQWRTFYPEPEYKHILWTDESARDLIKTHYNWFLETYDNYDMNIKRADASRYFILHHMGGIYADLDYEPLVNFYDYLPQNQVGLIESPYLYNEKIQNSLMTSPKGDPFWIHVFKGLAENADMAVLHATGPVFLDTMMDTSKHPVYTLPCENFHRIPYGELKNSKWTAILVRELVTRIVPMSKHCGYIDEENSCQFGKHHNTAAWTTESFF